MKIKITILFIAIIIVLLGVIFLYNSYTPITYTNICNDKNLFRYQFGIYKIDSLGEGKVELEQIGDIEDYFGIDKPACIDAINRYHLSLRKKEIDRLNKDEKWKKLRCGLYKNKNGEIAFQDNQAIGEGEFSAEMYIYKFGFNEGKSLKLVVDTTTFIEMGSNYYRDKNHIYYHYGMAHGGSFYINTEVDYKTFKVIGDVYAKDQNHVYVDRTGIVRNVDYKTFRSKIGIGPYAKDKNGYYYWGEKIDTLNNESDDYEKKAIKELDKL